MKTVKDVTPWVGTFVEQTDRLPVFPGNYSKDHRTKLSLFGFLELFLLLLFLLSPGIYHGLSRTLEAHLNETSEVRKDRSGDSKHCLHNHDWHKSQRIQDQVPVIEFIIEDRSLHLHA